MNDLIKETNSTLEEAIVNLFSLKTENEHKLAELTQDIEKQLQNVKEYKESFNRSKEKIAKMNDDINGFEADYQNLVEKFQNDELQNILVSANKEITLKIDERKKKIKDEQIAMNKLVQKASFSKQKLVKLTAEKKAIQLKLDYILDAYEFYNKTLSDIIEYSTSHSDDLCSYFGESKAKNEIKIEPAKEIVTEEVKKDDKKNKKDKNKEPKKIEIVEVEEKEEPIVEEEVQFDENTDAEDFFNFDDSIPD
jgi:chromosome segregation ATPase